MAYNAALWDGTDPLYAPGLSFTGDYPRWKAPARYVKAGYSLRNLRLDGKKGDGLELVRAMRCRDLTREMLQWFEGLEAPKLTPGTWHWLISSYRSDALSPIQSVKANTRENYEWQLGRWDSAIGAIDLAQTDYARIMGWKQAMQQNGRSVAYIKRMFTMIRTVAKYGSLIGNPEASRVRGILSDMRFKSPVRRTIAPTRVHIAAIVAASDVAGNHGFSLGLLMQFWLVLRAVDVRGQWLKSDDHSGIIRNGSRWQDGLTWDMIDRDITSITKVISKTKDSLSEAMVYQLRHVPDIQARLQAIPPEQRVGPVIRSQRDNLPFTRSGYSQAFRRYRDVAGVPDNIWSMDARSGAITEAKAMGAMPYDLRDAAGHKELTTTDIYARGRIDAVNRVIKLRKETQT